MGAVDTSVITTVAPLLILGFFAAFLIQRGRRSSATRSLATGWPHTSGTVLSATVQVSRQGKSRHETPLVLFAYQVDGQVFQGHRVRVGDELGRARVAGAHSSASATVTRYRAGTSVTVFYDPTNPANSALEQ